MENTKCYDRSGQEHAFTLIELLVVVSIIGILAAIALPVFMSQQAEAYKDAAVSDVRNASLVLEDYYAQNVTYPPAGAVPGFSPTDAVNVEIKASTGVGYCIEAWHVGLDEDGDGTPDLYFFETRTLKAMANVAAGACT